MMERTKIDRATISKLETGKLPNPSYQTIRDYAQALGKRVVWCVEDDDGDGGPAAGPGAADRIKNLRGG